MYYSNLEIVFQEVPGEVSICFTISGCGIRCKGCHSPNLWKKGSGQLLSKSFFKTILDKYKGMASCVLFMGGEWHKEDLISYLKCAQKNGYKTCLYSGETKLDESILSQLTWVKTGPWIELLGGLDSPKTNQKFIEVKTNNTLNHLFLKNY
ncbi:anaerobic ribonucleoside-triphosphate reductase activating protein [Flavivirga eckloniae]|uniref:Anaerobic ribonucleoside-triphosphate reductase activating protein n=1 Tax=Flavivirga eckloniae TaxID=1803846 RepID=A0A2K9PVV8_9FLAO|nr:anaerobic ribonucleoside-triphosphate reductase activating protein [Flavivirga eckloniae]AUP81205.1 anaerobic ribonucleoside-triphosphate reductase activating protein [Flavivirga eckloniae]